MKKTIALVALLAREHKQGHKEIDHVVPFIYLLRKHLSEKYEITDLRCIFSTYRSQLSDRNDPRIQFAESQLGVTFVDLRPSRWLRSLIKIARACKRTGITKPLVKIFMRGLRRYDKAHAVAAFNADLLGDTYFNADHRILFSVTPSGSMKKAVAAIKNIDPDAKWWVGPHGTQIFQNEMVHQDSLSKSEKLDPEKPSTIFRYPDLVMVTSSLELKRFASIRPSDDALAVIGSPRFCKEWLEEKTKAQLDGPAPTSEKAKVKILFLIPKPFINPWHEELGRIVHFLASYENFEIILNGESKKYPKLLMPDKSYNNIARYLIGSPYSTSALIDWADVVFHLGTGVIFESFIKEKLTVFPSYASANTAYSELYGAGINLSNRDQLRDFCNQLDDSVEATKTYYGKITREALDRFNQDFVNGGDQSVARRINEVITESLDSV